MFYVYAIYNQKHDKIYIGETEDLQKRIELHNQLAFKNSYTARFDGSWEVIYKESFNNRKDARLREKQLKSYRGREFVKQFIPV